MHIKQGALIGATWNAPVPQVVKPNKTVTFGVSFTSKSVC